MLFLNFTKQPTKTRKTTLVSDKILAKFNPGETRGPMQHKKKIFVFAGEVRRGGLGQREEAG